MRKAKREIKDPAELREIVERCDCCRVAMNAGVFPYIVALNYGYEFDSQGKLTFYFHSAREGRKLDLLRADPHVGFELDCDHVFRHMDRGMHCTMDYRSIIGTGVVEFITDRAEMQKAVDLMLEHHQSPPGFEVTDAAAKATAFLKLTVLEMTGKRKDPNN